MYWSVGGGKRKFGERCGGMEKCGRVHEVSVKGVGK